MARRLGRLLSLGSAFVPYLLAGCEGGEIGRPTAEIQDSAGVRVVVNPPPSPDTDPVWTVAEEPEVEIGVLDGDPEYQLFRVSGAVVMSDGRIAVANQGAFDLRMFDPEGRHLWTTGGEGDGPGEFRAIELLGRFGPDSILVQDFRLQRLSVFDDAGGLARSFQVDSEEELRFPRPEGVLEGGGIVVRQSQVYTAGEATTGIDRGVWRLYLAEPSGRVVETLAELPGAETFVLSQERSLSVWNLAFGRSGFIRVGGGRVAVANNDGYSVRILDARGAPVQVVRQRREPVPTSEADFDAFAESQLADVENEGRRTRIRRMLTDMTRHGTFPAFADIRLDRSGNLWVEEYRRPGDERPVWQVFDRDGVLTARVRTPPGLNVLDVGDDYLLGLVRDELDVERLRLHRLVRSAGGRNPEG